MLLKVYIVKNLIKFLEALTDVKKILINFNYMFLIAIAKWFLLFNIYKIFFISERIFSRQFSCCFPFYFFRKNFFSITKLL